MRKKEKKFLLNFASYLLNTYEDNPDLVASALEPYFSDVFIALYEIKKKAKPKELISLVKDLEPKLGKLNAFKNTLYS